MPKFIVSMPTTGRVTLEVEAPTEAEAIDAFYIAIDKASDKKIRDAHEWEYCEHVTRGNVFSGMQNDVDVSKCK